MILHMKMRALGIAILLLPALLAAQTIDKKPELKQEILDSLVARLEQRAFVPGVDFKKFREFLAAEQPQIDKAKNDEEFKTAVNSALRKFGFSHIVMATPKDMERRNTGKTVGIGITSYFEKGARVITRVVEKSPAGDAGLEVGDLIILVDGKPITETLDILGEDGSKIKLRVKKPNGKTFDYTITRRPFSTIQKDTLTFINPETAILKVHTFERAYDKDRIAELMSESMRAKNLIVDLRMNGGGAILNLFHLVGFFLDPDIPIGAMLDRTTLNRFKKENNRDPKDLKELMAFVPEMITPFEQKVAFRGNLAVLINPGSASASEIFTASLREQYGKVVDESGTMTIDPKIGAFTVIGQPSAGAVLFSTFNPIAQGFYLQLPVADYLTAGGVRLEANPIIPDVKVDGAPFQLPGKPDGAVDAALALFERAKLRETRSGGGG